MKNKFSVFSSLVLIFAVAGVAYALGSNPRSYEITNFQPGHSHESEITEGALQHSGGTDSYGCHNASVPYHCHKPKY